MPHYILLKVVADLRTQIHGTSRINKPTICGINNKWQKHMADEKHDLIYCRPNMKETKDLHRLTIYWFITKPFCQKNAWSTQWFNPFKRIATADSKGEMVTLSTNQSNFMIYELNCTTHPHPTSREAWARGFNVDAHFFTEP